MIRFSFWLVMNFIVNFGLFYDFIYYFLYYYNVRGFEFIYSRRFIVISEFRILDIVRMDKYL